MKAYVITIFELDRSIDVANRCIASGKKYGLDILPFQAWTPQVDIIKAFYDRKLPKDKFFDQWSRAHNAMACFLSHYTLWEKAAETGEDILIFEHDAVIRDEIPNVPFKGLLSFGKPSYGKYITPSTLGVNKLVSKQYLPGAHAYIVKPHAAEKLIRKAQFEAQPTDVFLHNSRFDFLEEYYPWPVEVDETFSTVQAVRGCGAKHAYRKAPDLYRLMYTHDYEKRKESPAH